MFLYDLGFLLFFFFFFKLKLLSWLLVCLFRNTVGAMESPRKSSMHLVSCLLHKLQTQKPQIVLFVGLKANYMCMWPSYDRAASTSLMLLLEAPVSCLLLKLLCALRTVFLFAILSCCNIFFLCVCVVFFCVLLVISCLKMLFLVCSLESLKLLF